MGRARILAVDDEPGMLRSVERVLAPHYDVHAVRLPSQALEIMAAEAERPGEAGESRRLDPFDLALLDIRMPEMDGFELMSRLLAIQPGLDVILMTGSTDERDARLVRAVRERAFFFLTKPFDREVLLTLVERCLEVRRLNTENRAHVERLERELAAARVFQQSLLPPRHATCGNLEIALHDEPCGEMCGDFCDYVLRPDQPSAVLLTDVSGHGAPAAMLTGMIKQVFRAAAPEDYAPNRVLERIVEASRHFPHDKHLTGIGVRIDPQIRALEFVNAGHPPALLLRADGSMVRLESSAPMIHAAISLWESELEVETFGPGDVLLLYTDGITEARNALDELFGADRLESVAQRLAPEARIAGGPSKFLRSLRRELAEFVAGRPLEDDLTLVALRRG
jgi:serine phosphatase RsbU (regulator of sigma subunit)